MKKSIDQMAMELIDIATNEANEGKEDLCSWLGFPLEIYYKEIMVAYANRMLQGQIKMDAELLKEILNSDDLLPEDYASLFEGNDYYGLLARKEFVLYAAKKTGCTHLLAHIVPEDTIRSILTDKQAIDKLLNKNPNNSRNYLSGEEEVSIWLDQLKRCENLLKDKNFIMKLLGDIRVCGDEIIFLVTDKCQEFLKEREFTERVFSFAENTEFNAYDSFVALRENMLGTEELSKDRALAMKYWSLLQRADNIDKSLLEDRVFFSEMLNNAGKDYKPRLALPEKYYKDIEILKKYVSLYGYDGISFGALEQEGVVETINQQWCWDNWTLNSMIMDDLRRKIEKNSTIVTHFGDDLDNKSAVEAIQRWAEDNDLIKIGHPLNVIRVPAGQIKEGYLNVDTGGHKGSRIYEKNEDETIIIDGDLNFGVKSACEALSKLGIYVPKQIVDLADTKPNRVSSLDSRSGLALVRNLNGEQTFKLAEAGLLDKTLTDEQLKEFGLEEAHKKQQSIIDNAVKKIEEYTVELPTGEKIVLSTEPIVAGSSIAYEKGIKYFISATEHLDANKKTDGVTFAITSKPGTILPEEILKFGRELAEKYRIDEKSSEVFVNPNKQMIVAGGPKNPNFKIPNISVQDVLSEIKNKFAGRGQTHSMEDVAEYVETINSAEEISKTMSVIVNEQQNDVESKKGEPKC